MTSMTPKAASQIADTQGVCIHSNWPVYRNFKWQPLIAELGVHHTRGSIGHQKDDLQYMKPLFDAGVKHCATIVQSSGGTLGWDDTLKTYPDALANIKAVRDIWGPSNIIALEGPNEFNNPKTKPADWAAQLRKFVIWMHNTVRSMPELANCKILPPAIWGRLLADYQALGSVDAYVDAGCLHYYTNTKPPTKSNTSYDQALINASILTPKIKWETESGYSDAVGPKVKAKYTARLLFETLLRSDRIQRIYNYELFDSKDTPKWGLRDELLNPRPAFYAIKNVMALYKDSGIPALTPLDIQIVSVGADQLHYVVHQKADGSYLVALFRDVISTEADMAPAMVKVTLAKVPSSVQHFQPTFDAMPKIIPAAATFTVPVSDQVSVLRLVP